MQKIKLTQGKHAVVDSKWFDHLNQWVWFAQRVDNTWYAVRQYRHGGRKVTILMHRLILELNDVEIDGMEVDHRNQNGLYNRRCNLRVATTSQNHANRRRQRNNSSGFTGVSWNKQRSRWTAQIQVNGSKIRLGAHTSKRAAALAYNRAARKHFGEFARLNKVA